MNLPRQSKPVPRTTDGSRRSDEETDKRQTAGAATGHGVQPSGYSDCYKLRGTAQQMCLNGYYS